MTERFFRLWALIKKEFLTILRDPKSRIIIIVPPLIQLTLFANILTMETKNADIAVIDASNTLESREFVAGIENSRWFGRVIRSDNLRQARENLKNENIHGILLIRQDFARRLKKGQNADVLLILDGRTPTTATGLNGYVTQIAAAFSQKFAARTGVAGASAQMRLTLPQALDLALSENPTVKVAEMEVQRYDYVKRQTWGNLLPQISASGSYTRSIVKSEMRGGISFGADNTFAVQGDLSLPLFAPSVYRTLKMNDAQMATAVEAARASRIDLTAEVKKAFYNILLAEQSLAVLRESEATVQRTVDDTQVQYKHGLASEYDLLTAQVQLSNLKPTILQTENSIKLAKLMLKMYLSIPEDVEIEVVGELDALRDDVLAGTDGLTTDVTDNSDLRSLELQEEVLRRSLKAANAGRMPTLAAFGSASYTGNDMEPFNFGGAAATDDSRYFWTHPISVGLQLSVPIFSGLTKMNRSRELKNQISQLSLQRSYARQQIDVQVRSALNDLLTARETMYAQELTVEQARKAYKISDTRYRAGAGTILELNSAQLSQTQAQLNFSQAIYDYLSAKAEYDRIVGREHGNK